MALGQRLELRQGQALVMTPQLQQAIKLLQLSNLELQAYVEAELERNPLLERDDGHGSDDAATAPEAAAPQGLDRELSEGVAPEAALDAGFENVYADESRADAAARAAEGAGDGFASLSGGTASSSRAPDDDLDIESRLTKEIGLKDHLERQMLVSLRDPGDRMIASYLIDLVDEAGYLPADLGDAAERLGVPAADVERVLGVLQGLDPTGVCARSLAECLALQLKEADRCDPAMQAMLDNLPLLARRDLVGLMRACGVDAEDLAGMIAEIKALNPKPGLAFRSDEPEAPAVPDVIVRLSPTGGWAVELNAETLPRVLVNQRYAARVSADPRAASAKTFMADCLASANWLVKSLDQRARTVLKVAAEIVRQQDGFLAHGVRHLRPLVLKNVAEAIGMHESTVSRVTSNKYVLTPRGLFELKYFFTAAIQSADGGDAHSAEAVRDRIRDLIERERPQDVLSDDRIVEILKAAGVDIARRTVAKYREAMRIPSSVDRRRLKALAG